MSKKRMGRTGGIKVSTTPDGATLQQTDRRFSGQKDRDERRIAKAMSAAVNRHLPFNERFRALVQNSENDIDFSSTVNGRRHFIELMEHAPLTGPYPQGAQRRETYLEATWIADKAETKGKRQGPGLQRTLFVYATHETFVLSETAKAVTAAMLSKRSHGYKSIWYGHYLGDETFITFQLFPRSDLETIDPEDFRNHFWIAADSSQARLFADENGQTGVELYFEPDARPAPQRE